MAQAGSNHDDWAEHAREYLIQEKCATSHWLLTDNLSELRLFLETLENFLEKEEQRDVAALTPQAIYPEFWADHYPYQWQQIIGSQLRQSFVVSLMSATEFHLGLFCRDVATIVQANITHDDLKGGLVARSRKFLNAFAHLATPPEKSWQVIEDLYALRNNIVHNAGLVDVGREANRLAALIKRSHGISNPSAGILEIKREFCSYAIDAVDNFFQDLHKQQNLLCQRAASPRA